MESGAISDGQLNASSRHASGLGPNFGRLHLKYGDSGGAKGSWAALDNDANQWLQVDLVTYYAKITRVATQGRNGTHAQWVTQYNLQYGSDGSNFQCYRAYNQSNNKVGERSYVCVYLCMYN